MIKITAVPDSWTEFYLLGITRDDSTDVEVQYAGRTEDITGMDWGEKDIEGVVMGNGARLVRVVPMTDESVTLKVYPVDADLQGDGFVQLFHPVYTTGSITNDTTVPVVVENSQERIRHKLVLLWCTTLPAAASTVPDTGEPAYRIQIINAYMTSYKPSFDGKQLSAEVTFKWAPFDKSGNGNKREESTDSTTPLDAATTAVTSWA